MAKETIILFVILLSSAIFCNTGSAFNAIQTAQHIIVLDPGHGGRQKGLFSSTGLEEKTLVLMLALKTAQYLEPRYNVLLTRTSDRYLPPRERVFLANKNKADLYLSIHLHQSSPALAFVYYFDLPESCNRSTPGTAMDWKSQALLHQSLSRQAVTSFSDIFSAHEKQLQVFLNKAPILLLEGTNMPAILIEPVSIQALSQHPDEIENTLDEYAVLISKSIDLYFRKNKGLP